VGGRGSSEGVISWGLIVLSKIKDEIIKISPKIDPLIASSASFLNDGLPAEVIKRTAPITRKTTAKIPATNIAKPKKYLIKSGNLLSSVITGRPGRMGYFASRAKAKELFRKNSKTAEIKYAQYFFGKLFYGDYINIAKLRGG
jgi:hypothetical protein